MSSGAPVIACETGTNIVPSHTPNAPSNSPLPYSVDLTDFTGNIYNPGRTYTSKHTLVQYYCHCLYTVTMRGGGSGNFKGFMIQGRVAADDSPTGTFAEFGTNFQSQCDNDVRLYYMMEQSHGINYCRQLLHMLVLMRRLQLLYHGQHHLLELATSHLGMNYIVDYLFYQECITEEREYPTAIYSIKNEPVK